MKMSILQLLSTLFIMILLSSCDSNVVFEEAMPEHIEALKTIPEEFQGIYICSSDSSILYAHENVIFIESYFRFYTTLDQVNETENCSIMDNALYLPGREECASFTYISEDTISVKVTFLDTLFGFRNFEQVKLYKGRLIFNLLDKSEHWTSFIVSPKEDGSLSFVMIDLSKDLDGLKDLKYKELLKDNVGVEKKNQYLIKPTLIEFNKLLERELTMICDSLVPIKYSY